MHTLKFQAVQNTSIDFPMDRERYLSTWKIFRSISNENIITAKHLLSLNSWDNISSILDLGCGDGLITKSIILNSATEIKKVILLDPDKEMLDEAFLHLTEIGIVPTVEKIHSKLEAYLVDNTIDTDIVLAIHLVYLISPELFKSFIDNLPIGKKVILVLDDEKSVFGQLWKRTAPKYAERSENVRHFLSDLSANYLVERSTITSNLINPLTQRTDIKDALLSLLSYSDFSKMNSDAKNYVVQTISENVTGRFLLCTSACYEIMKIG